MWGLLVSAIALLLFHAGILLFLYQYGKHQETKQAKRVGRTSVVIFVAYVIFQTLVHIYSGFGTELDVMTICLTASSLLLLILSLATIVSKQNTNFINAVDTKVFALTLVAYMLGIFFPSITATRLEFYCDGRTRETAEELVDASRTYMKVEGKYPDTLSDLVPSYLTEIPSPECFSLYSPFVPVLTDQRFLRNVNYDVMMELIKLKKLEYHVRSCEWSDEDYYEVEWYLIVPAFDLNAKQRYVFSSDTWQRIPFSYNECMTYNVSD